MRKKIIGILVVTLLIATAIPVVGIFNKTTYESKIEYNYDSFFIDDFDEEILLLMEQANLPSFTACIIKNDSIAWSKAYGYAELRSKRDATVDSIYGIGSCTKMIIASALMQLYEQDLFDLDDDVNDYLPFSLRNPNYPDVAITFRMLLAHQSSIVDGNLMNPLSLAHLFKFIKISESIYPWIEEALVPGGEYYDPEAWGDYPPGEQAFYSNMGFNALGFLLEQISGQSYIDYCQEHIFTPLDMMNTSFNPDDFDNNQLVQGYLGLGQPIFNLGIFPLYFKLRFFNWGGYGPNGGIVSTVEDLAHFLIVHMNGGMYNGVRILEESSVEEMHRIQYPNSSYYEIKFGLGWYEEIWYNRSYIGHWGNGGGCNSVMSAPLNDTGIIFSYNLYRFRFIPDEEETKGLMYDLLMEKANEL